MLEVPIYNTSGQKIDTLKISDERFGTEVNVDLVKQAVVIYHARKRQGTVATKGRGDVEGSTKKLFAQKHTGNARRGNIRTNVMRGGGVGFPKRPHKYDKDLPKGMRRKALDSAILAKILGQDLMVLDGLKIDAPKTKIVAGVLSKLNINRSCLLTIPEHNAVLWKSARNIPDLAVCLAGELNAFDVATRRKMLVTREAMELIINRPAKI